MPKDATDACKNINPTVEFSQSNLNQWSGDHKLSLSDSHSATLSTNRT